MAVVWHVAATWPAVQSLVEKALHDLGTAMIQDSRFPDGLLEQLGRQATISGRQLYVLCI